MELIICSKKYGKFILFYDKIDMILVNNHAWHIAKMGEKFHAVTNIRKDGKRRPFSLPNLIMGGGEIIHIDHNLLNNRRANLRLSNTWKITETSAEVNIFSKINGNHVAVIDLEDLDKVRKYNWSITSGKGLFYCCSFTGGKGILMHSLVMNSKIGQIVDHRDRNGLNNKKSNLRFASQSQNIANSKMQKKNTTGYKGVYRSKRGDRYRVQLVVNGKAISGGQLFDHASDAAIRYNELAQKHFGQFARLNEMP